ncbi:MAG: DUF1189 family protein, partial [Candidatus Omnitrophica bacterium]|nr:DUF1189 family protein [Candidatus Omnitrophota bacterium]
MNTLTAPLYALFSIPFYRLVVRSPLYRGFLYLLYLAGIATAIILLSLIFFAVPFMDKFMDWVKAEMPVITFSSEGISLNVPSPYTMTHPTLGPLITFDMTATDVDSGKMGNVNVFVTAKKVFVRQGPNEIRMYDLTPPAPPASGQGAVPAQPAVLDPDTAGQFYQTVKPWLILVVLFFFFV